MLYIYHCKNDASLISSPLFKERLIVPCNIRTIHDAPHFDHRAILLSSHSTNCRLIQFVRGLDVLTPIYIVGTTVRKNISINGIIRPEELSYWNLMRRVCFFPERPMWRFVFHHDRSKNSNIQTVL